MRILVFDDEVQVIMSRDESDSYSKMIGSVLRGEYDAFEEKALDELRSKLSFDPSTRRR